MKKARKSNDEGKIEHPEDEIKDGKSEACIEQNDH